MCILSYIALAYWFWTSKKQYHSVKLPKVNWSWMDIRSSKRVWITGPSIKFTWHSHTPQRRCSGFYWSFVPVTNHLLLDIVTCLTDFGNDWYHTIYTIEIYTTHLHIKKTILDNNTKFSKMIFWCHLQHHFSILFYRTNIIHMTTSILYFMNHVKDYSLLNNNTIRPIMMWGLTFYYMWKTIAWPHLSTQKVCLGPYN
jgi:hypothetical protein